MNVELLQISFNVEPTAEPLTVSVLLDNETVWQQTVDKKSTVKFSFPDDTSEHEIVLRLHDKTSGHTKVDEEGNILQDSLIAFSNFVVDDIDISQTFIEKSTYYHNFNGNGAATIDEFFGIMGCNGAVNFKFSTPFYLWLLENM